MPTYRAKPPAPLWRPASAPAGCKGYWLLAEGAGPAVRDLSGGSGKPVATFTGSPTWARGPYGPQLGGFSTSSYVAIDPPTQPIATGTYPFWLAGLATSGSTAEQCLGGLGSATNNFGDRFRLNYNGGGTAGTLRLDIVVSGTTYFVDATGLTINDGLPHVAMAATYGVTDTRIYLDGKQVGSSAAPWGGTVAASLVTLGASRRNTNINLPLGGALIAFALGSGAVPDPAALAADWLSGSFAAARPPRRTWVFAVGGPMPTTATLSGSGQDATAALAATVTPPPSTGTLAGPAGSVSGALAATVTPPAATTALAGAAGSATAAVAGTVTPPATIGTLATQGQDASAVLSVLAIAGVSGTLSGSGQDATSTLAVQVTPPAATGTLAGSGGDALVSLAATVIPPATTVTIGATVPAATAALTGSNTPPAATGTLGGSVQPAAAALSGLTGNFVVATLAGSGAAASASLSVMYAAPAEVPTFLVAAATLRPGWPSPAGTACSPGPGWPRAAETLVTPR